MNPKAFREAELARDIIMEDYARLSEKHRWASEDWLFEIMEGIGLKLVEDAIENGARVRTVGQLEIMDEVQRRVHEDTGPAVRRTVKEALVEDIGEQLKDFQMAAVDRVYRSKIGPTTPVYLVADTEVQWLVAAESAESAVAEAMVGMGVLDTEEPPNQYEVARVLMAKLAEFEKTLSGYWKAFKEGQQIEDYDHGKALQMASKVDQQIADQRVQTL